MQNINSILPNLSTLDLDHQDLVQLNQLFNKRALDSLDSSINLNNESDTHQYAMQNCIFNMTSQSNANGKASPSQSLLDLLALPATPQSNDGGKTYRINPKIKQITSQTLQTISKTRQSQLLSELEYLKEELKLLQNHLQAVNLKYQQKRQQANQFMLKYVQVRDQHEQLLSKYEGMQAQYQKKQRELRKELENQYKLKQQKMKADMNAYQCKMRSLQEINKKLEEMLLKTQAQYDIINSRLQNQTLRFSYQLKQSSRYCEQTQAKLKFTSQQLQLAKAKLAAKTKQCIQKDQKLQSLQKTVRQVNQRMVQIQKDTKKQLLKSRSITKKAIDGLQMTRKYSQMELNKSRKKEKILIQKEKQLIHIIKDICREKQPSKQKEMLDKQQGVSIWELKKEHTNKSKSKLGVKSISKADTADADLSSKRSQVKSFNTTLQLKKQSDSNYSPFISNFITDDSQLVNPNYEGQQNFKSLRNSQISRSQYDQNGGQNRYQQGYQSRVLYQSKAEKQHSPNARIPKYLQMQTQKIKDKAQKSKNNQNNSLDYRNISKQSSLTFKNKQIVKMERQSSNNVLKLDSSIYRDDDNQKDCKIINKTNGGDNYKNISIKLNKNKSNIPNKKNSNILNIDVNFEYNDPNYYSLSSANSLSGSGTPCFQVRTAKNNYRNFKIAGHTKNQYPGHPQTYAPVNQY